MTTPQVFAYYFPDWHADARNAGWFGESWTEWELVRAARPRFPGHRQPRVPTFGHFDEADPQQFDRQTELAAAHGVDGIFFDYYWYDDGPYLQRALDDGFLRSSLRSRLKFALMWANHPLVDIFPSQTPGEPGRQLKAGALDRAAFEAMARHVTAAYFSQPNYLVVDGRPWLSVYELGSLVAGLGGVAATRDALGWFDDHVRASGFAGLHLDGVVWSLNELPAVTAGADPARTVIDLGFRSATSYVWIHHADVSGLGFPIMDWDEVRRLAFTAYEGYAAELSIPFHPNVTVGWDSSPRTAQGVPFVNAGYPWKATADPEPAQFAAGLREALAFLDRHPSPYPMITINAWNEWSEGSALLPDTVRGTGYLEALRDTLRAARWGTVERSGTERS